MIGMLIRSKLCSVGRITDSWSADHGRWCGLSRRMIVRRVGGWHVADNGGGLAQRRLIMQGMGWRNVPIRRQFHTHDIRK